MNQKRLSQYSVLTCIYNIDQQRKIYALLTKREVKMAGYWHSSFFCIFKDRDEVEVHKNAKKKNEANIQPS